MADNEENKTTAAPEPGQPKGDQGEGEKVEDEETTQPTEPTEPAEPTKPAEEEKPAEPEKPVGNTTENTAVAPKKPTVSRSQAKRETAQKPAEPVAEEANEEYAPADDHEGYTKIESADRRTLEVSINEDTYIGKVIYVKNEQAGEAKRLLADGGYFTKN